MSIVLDASAILAALLDEKGAAVVIRSMRQATVSTVNLSEAIVKAGSRTGQHRLLFRMVDRFDMRIVSFDYDQALLAAELRERTKVKGLSFADRACLALALTHDLPVLTGDRKWCETDLGIDIRLIR